MKWGVLVLALAAILPLTAVLRRYPRMAPFFWVLIGALPFAQSKLSVFGISVVAWPDWPGFVKGAQISALDLIAIAVYLSLPAQKVSIPFKIVGPLYLATVVLSALQAEEPQATMFYTVQLVRVFFFYLVVLKGMMASKRFPLALMTGMALGLMAQAGIVVGQKLMGALQPAGTFGHQNLLGMVSHLVVFPLFALLLAGYRSWQSIGGPFAGAIIAVLTASRATIGLAGVGYAVLYSISTFRRRTLWKSLIGVGGAVFVVILAQVALATLANRFSGNPLDGHYDERVAFERAADAILDDHPFGIGANNYSYFSTTQGYSAEALVATLDLTKSPHVHNTYKLAAAETGYLGLATLMLLLLRVLVVAFRAGWRSTRRGDPRGELLLGFATALLVVYLHCNFEWIFFTTQVQYLMALDVGMIAGLATQLNYWPRRVASRRVLRRDLAAHA
jgi:O-antigen ligase